MAKRVSTDAWVGRTTVPKGKVVVEEQEAFFWAMEFTPTKMI